MIGGLSTNIDLSYIELRLSLCRLLLKYFKHAAAPHQAILSDQQAAAHADVTPDMCALVTLRAQQQVPELLLHCWTGAPWFELLGYGSAVVRWCAVQAVSGMLQLSNASSERLTQQMLHAEQLVETSMRWGIG